MASKHGGLRRMSPLAACFAGRPGVWGVPHPARDQWRVPRGAALRKDRDLVYLFSLDRPSASRGGPWQ